MDTVNTKPLVLYGHVNGRLIIVGPNWVPPGQRKQGRPRRSWKRRTYTMRWRKEAWDIVMGTTETSGEQDERDDGSCRRFSLDGWMNRGLLSVFYVVRVFVFFSFVTLFLIKL